MDGVKLPSTRADCISLAQKNRIVVTKEQMDTILKRFPQGSPDYIPLMFGYRCGLRLGEAFAVTWDDIDFDKKTLSVNRQIQWHSKDNNDENGYWYLSLPKYDSNRTISIDDAFLNILRKEKEKQEKRAKYYLPDEYTYYYAENPNQMNTSDAALKRVNTEGIGNKMNFVCIRDDGTYINPRTMQYVSQVIHNNLGIPNFDFHSLRHTHCTMLIDNGEDPKYVQHRLGHKKIDVTYNTYRHLTNITLQTGDNILNKMFEE